MEAPNDSHYLFDRAIMDEKLNGSLQSGLEAQLQSFREADEARNSLLKVGFSQISFLNKLLIEFSRGL